MKQIFLYLVIPKDVDPETPKVFVDEVMELMELTPLSGALIGLSGVDGLSTEQRKRLTMVVELVANSSIVFMDEPISGLDITLLHGRLMLFPQLKRAAWGWT